MKKITYLPFSDINPGDFLTVLNSERVRAHLVAHDQFTLESLQHWMEGKIAVDRTKGCRVRAVLLDNVLIGWCAIQFEEGRYELAVIIDDKSWGLGKQIYRDLMNWAQAFGHQVVYIHLLHTRPPYRFLAKLAQSVSVTRMLGTTYTTYALAVR